jgi:hypothetical protein
MKKAIIAVLPLVLFVFALWSIWMWLFCRFYVGPDEMAIITAKNGKPLAEGQILAEPGQQGIQAAPLAEGVTSAIPSSLTGRLYRRWSFPRARWAW